MSSTNHTSTPRSPGSHINVAQQPPPKSCPTPSFTRPAPSWWSRIGVDHWEWELSAAILCVSALAAIVAVLVSYDQRPVPDLPAGLTVTTLSLLLVFSFLTSVSTTDERHHLFPINIGERLPVPDIGCCASSRKMAVVYRSSPTTQHHRLLRRSKSRPIWFTGPSLQVARKVFFSSASYPCL